MTATVEEIWNEFGGGLSRSEWIVTHEERFAIIVEIVRIAQLSKTVREYQQTYDDVHPTADKRLTSNVASQAAADIIDVIDTPEGLFPGESGGVAAGVDLGNLVL